ncbi:MAG: phosphoribosylformylglycinamidine synthase subunit PurS [Actinobacteria bacterium]|nr:phosphoribosylformylglycinamidine synthase subunit PurS [Micrococcales bacterium]MCB0905050.1 phosphoribosylformylglycinamidine synthase subunit PurS [Actinomycetota bacterium]MCO5301120.1 phosphoribosylformylglycinamidine synthase subunit PurS [Candidatus Nanopelagicales bacterium]MCB9427974.1 phosphoribosylformylglycinamidine synthase subunit PurS [Actinomycetota bacterium]HPE12576.1 phosphoribosylformylglycinamidine synthase subunit PurS [Actinomycetota bacterium]
MPRIIVEVMPKAELLDPQGQAVQAALGRLGVDGVVSVRQGKRFEIEVEGQLSEQRMIELEHVAETLLANPVIENHQLTVE